MDLGGRWRAIEADDALRREFHQPELDDRDWTTIDVPGHWRSYPAFAGSDGPLLYRRRFDVAAPAPGRRSWLVFDGLFYEGDVWLDGSYLGDTEGYFFPHSFEVTEQLSAQRDHLLAVEVACTPPADRRAKRNLTGVFQHWDCIDPDWNPGGIWRSVRIIETGPVRLVGLTALCPEASSERARVDVSAVLESTGPRTVSITTTLVPAGTAGPGDRTSAPARSEPREPSAQRQTEHLLAAGTNRVNWSLAVERPELWWPAALGDQPLYDLCVSVHLESDEATGSDAPLSDGRTVRLGLRQVRMNGFVATINGERLFLKGANYGPTRRAIGEATAAEIDDDVALARQANLDLLRIHAHVGRPELYEAADRHGLLIWQDLPLQWGYSGVRRQAVRQAREAVRMLGHHPSIIIWCGHNEPFNIDMAPGASPAGRRKTLRYIRAQALPSLNKTRLDGSIRRALEKADSSRPVVANSGVLPHPVWGTDTHLYYGWYHGEAGDLGAALARFPVLARFVGEFGAQAVPETADFMEPARWPELDWERLGHHYALQRAIFERRVPPGDHATFDEWRRATQEYQSELIRRHVETIRRLKYRPSGGFCQFLFADAQPAVTWSVLDDQRVAKPGFQALAESCQPVIVVADWPSASYRPGERVALDVHVVSDLRQPLAAARLRADLVWPGGSRRWWFEGDVAADACSRIGRLDLVLPEDAGDGPLAVELQLCWRASSHLSPDDDDGEADVGVHTVTRRYESAVRRGLRAPAP